MNLEKVNVSSGGAVCLITLTLTSVQESLWLALNKRKVAGLEIAKDMTRQFQD